MRCRTRNFALATGLIVIVATIAMVALSFWMVMRWTHASCQLISCSVSVQDHSPYSGYVNALVSVVSNNVTTYYIIHDYIRETHGFTDCAAYDLHWVLGKNAIDCWYNNMDAMSWIGYNRVGQTWFDVGMLSLTILGCIGGALLLIACITHCIRHKDEDITCCDGGVYSPERTGLITASFDA